MYAAVPGGDEHSLRAVTEGRQEATAGFAGARCVSPRRLGGDWRSVNGVDVLLAETFVDAARFAGTCHRAADPGRL